MSPRRTELNVERLRRRSTMDRYLETLEAPTDDAGGATASLPTDRAVADPEQGPVNAAAPVAAPEAGAPPPVPDDPQPAARVDADRVVDEPLPPARPRRARRETAKGEALHPPPPPELPGAASTAEPPPATSLDEEPYVLLNTELTPATIRALHAAAWSDGRDGDKSPLVRAAIEAALDEFEALDAEAREVAVARLRRRTLEPRVVRVYRVTSAIRDRLIAINRDEAVPLRALPRDAIERRYGEPSPELEPGA